jgi:hypothetical protein
MGSEASVLVVAHTAARIEDISTTTGGLAESACPRGPVSDIPP